VVVAGSDEQRDNGMIGRNLFDELECSVLCFRPGNQMVYLLRPYCGAGETRVGQLDLGRVQNPNLATSRNRRPGQEQVGLAIDLEREPVVP
jgi:hypothetical protein